MAVLRRGVLLMTALSERIINLTLICRRYSTSTPSPPPDECVAIYDRALIPRWPRTSTVEHTANAGGIQRRIIVYDGVCHLCHSGVKWLIKVDKEEIFRFCCLQSKAAEGYLQACGLEQKDVFERFLFFEDRGLHYQGAAAALKILSYLPPPYSALSALDIFPSPLMDALYDTLARDRYYSGKDDECIVLNERELLVRFIDADEILERYRYRLLYRES